MKKIVIVMYYFVFAVALLDAVDYKPFLVRVVLMIPYSYLAIKLYRNEIVFKK